MKKIVSFVRQHKWSVVFVVIGFAIGFSGGMEYKKYQIRQSLKEIGQSIGDIFSGVSTPTEKINEVESQQNKLFNKVTVEPVSKDFKTEGYKSFIIFDFKLANNTDKNIKAFHGTIHFYDIFDKEIQSREFAYTKGIAKESLITWNGGFEYNQFIDSDVQLKSTDFDSLKYKWEPDKIIYEDGTTESK